MKYSLMGALAAVTVGVSLAGAQNLPVSVQAEWGEGFGYLSAVRELPDGRVLVADPLGQLLMAVDMDSGATEPWGREGAGHMEWRQPDAVYALPGGETLLVDLGNGRLVRIGADKEFGQTYPIARMPAPSTDGGGAPGGGRRMMMAPTMLLPGAVDSQGTIYFTARGGMNPTDSSTVTTTTLDDDATNAVGKVKPQEMVQSGSAQERMIAPVPMSPQDDWAAGADGTVVFVRSDGYFLEIRRPDGSIVRGPSMDVDRLRPTDADKVAYLEGAGSGGIRMEMTVNNGNRQLSMSRGGGGGGGEPDITQAEWPSRMPAFRAGSTAIAPDGRIFVGRTVHAGDPALFDVFDSNGRVIGQTEFGPNTSIVGFGADGAIYVAETDMFGLQWLKKVVVG